VRIIIKDQSVKDSIGRENVKKAIEDNEIVLILLHNETYSERIKDIAKMISAFGKSCYVSANKPHQTMLKEFEKANIDSKNFFFIDCVSRSSEMGESKVVHVSSPKALTEMNIAINKVLTSEKINLMVFDSLSTLLIYEDTSNVVRFAHSIISLLRMKGSKGVLISLKDDTKSELIKDLNMFVDKVVEMG
jgi:archaellum biogenesis ATPase FlaH